MESSFVDDLTGSLDLVELMMALEDELNTEILMKKQKALKQLEM